MNKILLANSNGTLIEDISDNADYRALIETISPGIHDKLAEAKKDTAMTKELSDKIEHEYRIAANQVALQSDYGTTLVNGAAALPGILGSNMIGLFATASEEVLDAAYSRNVLGKYIHTQHCVDGSEFSKETLIGHKDELMFRQVACIYAQQGVSIEAYLTHKRNEAEVAAKVLGLAFLIDPESNYRREEYAGGVIIHIPSIDDPQAISHLRSLYFPGPESLPDHGVLDDIPSVMDDPDLVYTLESQVVPNKDVSPVPGEFLDDAWNYSKGEEALAKLKNTAISDMDHYINTHFIDG